MKYKFLYLILFSFLMGTLSSNATPQQAKGWKAGVAKVIITPSKLIWMAGYGGRDHPAEGTLLDIYAKALAIEDASGNRAVLVTTDLLGIPKNISDQIRAQLQETLGLSKAQIILNSSHTHTGPVLDAALPDIYPLNENQWKDVEKYSSTLISLIVSVVNQAFASLEPVKIYTNNGVSRFQVNRRNNDEATLHTATELNGPNDYAVPVIKVENESGEVKAIAFGYACHPTVLSFYQWSGDYPGFAQLVLEKKYPGATALFFQGAGADQNPLPRRTVALAQQYGQTLAASVERVLNEEMKELNPKLSVAYTEIELSLNSPPDIETLEKMVQESSSYQKRWAERMLKNMNAGEPLASSYPYPIQVWKLGNQAIFSLGGELVVEYAIQLKRVFGSDIFVLGYSNDVMAYIPSARILQEGGYEGATSQIVYGLPSTWSGDIEAKIIAGMVDLAKQIDITKQTTPLLGN